MSKQIYTELLIDDSSHSKTYHFYKDCKAIPADRHAYCIAEENHQYIEANFELCTTCANRREEEE